MSRLRSAWLCLVLPACAGTPALEQRSAADARGYYYSDDAGLSVTTGAASVEHPVGGSTTLEAIGVIERIRIGMPNGSADTPAHAGHQHHGGEPGPPAPEVDVVSSASATARFESDATLLRKEAQLHARRGVGSRGVPADVGLQARYSTEPYYRSFGLVATGRVDLFQSNLTLGGFLSLGHDTIEAASAPPGEADRWPASHDRVHLGTSASQLLGPDTVLHGTMAVGRQSGALENPYRRVLVKTSLFPERVPNVRWRFTGSLGIAQYLGGGFAAHLRSGMYGDSWGVSAWIPEVAIAKELGQWLVADVHARWYAQGGASFYRHHYETLEAHLTADIRLGSIAERAVGAYLAFVALPASSPVGELSLDIGYERSWLDYRELNLSVAGQLLQAGIAWKP